MRRLLPQSRPQLKIGARTTQDARVRKDEAYRGHDHKRRRTLAAIKESVIERTCEAAMYACEAGVAGVIETLVKTATAEANAAAARVRAEAKIEKTELQAELTQCQSVINRLQGELSLTRQQLDAAMAERSKRIEKSSVVAPAPAGPASPPIADTQVAVREAHPEAAQNIKRVLEQVRAIYDQDLNSDRSSAELVDSLTTRLQQARDVILARSSLSERDTKILFEQQIDVMLDLMVGTSFGRHLSIAAYAAR